MQQQIWTPTKPGPYQALGCGDAWCVLDAAGKLAWTATDGRLSPLADHDTAVRTAAEWNAAPATTH